MKKLIVLGFMVVCSVVTHVRAQSSNTPITLETVKSLPPKDGLPMTFSTSKELNKVVPPRIAELKQLIVDFQHDPDKATVYREELWRLENAKVVKNK